MLFYGLFAVTAFIGFAFYGYKALDVSPSTRLELVSEQGPVKLGVKYRKSVINGMIHMTFESLNFTIPEDGEAISSLHFPIDDLPMSLHPIHKPPSDIVIFREHPRIDPYEAMNTYFDIKTRSHQDFLVFTFPKEFAPGSKVLTRTVDIMYQIK